MSNFIKMMDKARFENTKREATRILHKAVSEATTSGLSPEEIEGLEYIVSDEYVTRYAKILMNRSIPSNPATCNLNKTVRYRDLINVTTPTSDYRETLLGIVLMYINKNQVEPEHVTITDDGFITTIRLSGVETTDIYPYKHFDDLTQSIQMLEDLTIGN
jgi:hypothetical protein